jgi:hypothetical protein
VAKVRTPVPPNITAEVLFAHDHTCCYCRERGKAVQIHHIDDDPSNHVATNLAVLCLEDHNDTQVTGGFGRKLSDAEVRRYRDDWLERVRNRREEADRIAATSMAGNRAAAPSEWTRPSPVALVAYIRHLPELRRSVYAAAQKRWDRGSTAEVVNATREAIDVFERALMYLAGWFPPGHFDGMEPELYFSNLTAQRFQWHYALFNPQGPGTAGTLARVLTAGAVLDDVGDQLRDIVLAIGPYEELDTRDWKRRWDAAKEPLPKTFREKLGRLIRSLADRWSPN